jgi:hypothetical protein
MKKKQLKKKELKKWKKKAKKNEKKRLIFYCGLHCAVHSKRLSRFSYSLTKASACETNKNQIIILKKDI